MGADRCEPGTGSCSDTSSLTRLLGPLSSRQARLLGEIGVLHRDFASDRAAFHQLRKRLFETFHLGGERAFERFPNGKEVSLFDRFSDERSVEQDLNGRIAATP